MVGKVSSMAHVEDVGNTLVGLKLNTGSLGNPFSGISSAPEKKLSTLERVTTDSMIITTVQKKNYDRQICN